MDKGDSALPEQHAEYERRIAELEAANQALRTEIAGQKQQRLNEQQRATDLLSEADRRKDQFLAMLGHELRNPLSAIAGAVQVMSMVGLEGPEASQMRQIIERQTAHMSRMINEILEVSRISRGIIELRPVLLNVVELVRHTVEDGQQTFEGKIGIQLLVPEAAITVLGDPTRLGQVLMNLLQNAVKFTDPGGTITISVSSDPVNHAALITVRDTGIGMSPETVAHVFEPFSQADATVERSRGGLGLGLTLVKGLIDLHRGQVFAASPGLGRGAEFTIQLPLATPQEKPVQADAQDGLAGQALRILIIDDQRDASYPLRRLLELDGHRVEVAADGPTGIEAASHFQPQVILCDIGLPGGMNGFDVAQRLRTDPRIGTALLVAVTGYGQDEDRRQSVAAGFDRHLTKPVGQSELRSLLSDIAEQGSA